jgi:mycothiol synthase
VEPLAPPSGYAARPATAEDLPGIVGMVRACDVADLGEPAAELEWFEDDWRRPRFDPATESWLVLGPDGTPAAFGFTWDEIEGVSFDSAGWVHPAHRGRGLGTLLVRSVERRAARDVASLPSGSAPRIHQSFSDSIPEAHALMRSFGYERERLFMHMAIDLRQGAPSVGATEGFAIRPYRQGNDDRAVYLLEEATFADHWGQVPRTYEEFADDFLVSSSFDPGLWVIAEAGDEPVGFAIGVTRPDHGWVSDIGVLSDYRRRGIGEALLRRMFELFAARGFEEARLNVDAGNTTGATRLYERAGMHPTHRWAVYAKVLTGLR